jgi:adenosylhomocysteine nucleosidase
MRASQAAKMLLESGATALLSWGIAGGLIPELSPGSLVLPQTIIAADQTIYHVNTTWHERLCRKMKGHLDFHTEPIAESTSVLSALMRRRHYTSEPAPLQ